MNPRAIARLAILTTIASVAVACTAASSGSLPPIPSITPGASTPAPTHPGPTYPPGCPTTQPAPLSASDTRTVTITTDKGTITIKVEGKLSPIATGNFVALASCGYYNSVAFHRVVPRFVIQGGDGQFGRSPDVIPGLVGSGGPPYRIQDEKVTAMYQRGVVAMARSKNPNSVGSQFFIVLDDSAAKALADPSANNYQIIGAVSSGMDVADAIAAAAGGQELPDAPVLMTKVTVANP